jgi:hypothetical protein
MTPKQQLDRFIDKFSKEVAVIARGALARMRKQLPTATAMVYDNYNALAIGFGPTERASDAIFSIAVFPRWVSLFFLQGVGLPDPDRLLRGKGNVVRHIVLAKASDLELPGTRALMEAALASAKTPLPAMGRGMLVIKSISKKQRPRRPAKR